MYLEQSFSKAKTTNPVNQNNDLTIRKHNLFKSHCRDQKNSRTCRMLSTKAIRLNSSRPPCLFCICLPPKTTAMGRPNLSTPCKNILLCDISFEISVGEMYPFGTKLFLHFRYFNNIVEALSTSRSLARRNLLIAKSSTS